MGAKDPAESNKAVNADSLNLSAELGKELPVIESLRRQGLFEMCGGADADKHGCHLRLMQCPCERKVGVGKAGAGGNRLQSCEPTACVRVEIDILMPRHPVKARTGLHALLMLAGQGEVLGRLHGHPDGYAIMLLAGPVIVGQGKRAVAHRHLVGEQRKVAGHCGKLEQLYLVCKSAVCQVLSASSR